MGAILPALFLGVLDWIAVGIGNRRAEYVLKPATLAALMVAAFVIGDEAPARQATFTLAALMFSLAGDVFLMLPGDLFLPGLGAFLVAHCCYIVAFAPVPYASPRWWVVVAVVATIAFSILTKMLRASRSESDRIPVLPVIAYVVVIGAMAASAVGTMFGERWPLQPALFAAGGAVLFFCSDALIGWTRFVAPVRSGRVAIMVTYHLGQMGLVLALLR